MELDDLSRLIINHRNKRNLTQKQLASKMGVTQVAVAHWESGKSKPSAESYQKLNLLLHLDTPDIAISDLNIFVKICQYFTAEEIPILGKVVDRFRMKK